ncbi:hypothetical protein EG68_12583 [Paragonimus skrjabini miyazakii]|uniref:Uncharacterized protein n=1 Tax=Paragonimus skrjabini miyazakii TaxID=59628 RepID=A0A8S9YFJ1_9TREM|nr:hypothetical protein EG68_12583 [Paragonimus skrjabini miyazakii]
MCSLAIRCMSLKSSSQVNEKFIVAGETSSNSVFLEVISQFISHYRKATEGFSHMAREHDYARKAFN